MFDETAQPSEPKKEKKNKLAKKLSENITVGDSITFTDTIASNTDEFELSLWIKIAKNHNLDPQKDEDHKKIISMSKDPNVVGPIKEELAQESMRSYAVTEIINPQTPNQPDPQFDYNQNFFERFNFLPNSGIEEVTSESVQGTKKAYIGGGSKTTAFTNIEEYETYGDTQDSPTYLSTDYEIAMTHISDQEERGKPILVQVSLPKLFEYRKVFKDPESDYIESEREKTFIAFHGIPLNCIDKIFVLEKQ